MILDCKSCKYEAACGKSRSGHHRGCHSERERYAAWKIRQAEENAKRKQTQVGDEVYLTKSEYMTAYNFDEKDFARIEKQGLPYEIVNGVKMYPDKRCHRWFAGEEKQNA